MHEPEFQAKVGLAARPGVRSINEIGPKFRAPQKETRTTQADCALVVRVLFGRSADGSSRIPGLTLLGALAGVLFAAGV